MMLDMFKKSMLTGLGLVIKTRDEVESVAKEWIEKQKMSESEGRKFMDDLLKKYDDSREKLEDRVEKMVKDTLKKRNIATREEVEALKKSKLVMQDELLVLRREVEKLKEKVEAGSASVGGTGA
ncbi:MAG: phasin family protein [Thermodesulfobacteriota bacterium]